MITINEVDAAMPKILTPEQIRSYHADGYVAPIDVLPLEKAVEYRRRMEESERAWGPIRAERRAYKPHLLFRWAAELVRESAVLDAVEDIIGPNILVYQFTIFPKESRDPGFVDWHQDATYFSLKPDAQIAAWVAVSDASLEAGCMEVIPGSQLLDQLPHEDRASKHNLLSRGQTVAVPFDTSRTDFMPLATGQMSLHHTHILHRSGPNNSADRRIGFGVSYIPTDCRCTSKVRVTASLVRGVDTYGHFDPEPVPKTDYDADARLAHAEALQRYNEMRALIYQ